jgi:lysophospholipase L1-like esterase
MSASVIVALGDSTAGTPGFQSPIEAPPNGSGNVESQYGYWLTKTHPDWRVLNCGVNGERSDQIRARFERDVIGETKRGSGPFLVVIIAGVNDVYQGRSADEVERALQAMYDAARAARLPVVAGSIIPYNTATDDQNWRMHAINAWIRVRGEPRGLRVLRHAHRRGRAGAARSARVLPDGLHPSPDGYRLMALALEPAIRQLLARAQALL